jgi:AraC-like DNA-binding protein
MTFREWRRQARLLMALEYLASGKDITTVAHEVGYHSTDAFIETFRKCLGATPSRYCDSSQGS